MVDFSILLIVGVCNLVVPNSKVCNFAAGLCLGVAFLMLMFHLGFLPKNDVLEFMNVCIDK